MAMDVQWVVLGSGEQRYETLFASLARPLPQKVWAYIGFNNELAHLIEAGADMFLMPSQYEPCGMNQMYSLRYGTVPIVRKTGGLADTVHDWDECKTEGLDLGNGFSFIDATGDAMSTCLYRSLEAFKDRPLWQRIMINGMKRDFSWKVSAKKYVALYEKAMAGKREGIVA